MGHIFLVISICNIFRIGECNKFLPEILLKDISNFLLETANHKDFTQWSSFIDRKIETVWLIQLHKMTSYLHFILSFYQRQKCKEVPNYCKKLTKYDMKMGIFGRICGIPKKAKLEEPQMSFCQMWKEGKDKQHM